jgi:hypothetical protein
MLPGSPTAGPFAAPAPARRGIAGLRPQIAARFRRSAESPRSTGRPLSWPGSRGRLVNVLVFGCGPLALVGIIVAAFMLVSPDRGSAASRGSFQPGPAATAQQLTAGAPASTAAPSSPAARKEHHRRGATASPSAARVLAGPRPGGTRKATHRPTHSSGGTVPRNLGPPDFDGYCSHVGDGTAKLTADNAYGWRCTLDTFQVLQISDVCAWTYRLSASLVVGVSANYYDANAWQCWRVHGDLGQLDVSKYCAAAGLGTSKLVADNAYGWECTASSSPVDTTAACDTVYHVRDAISRFAVFADPYSWQCWD